MKEQEMMQVAGMHVSNPFITCRR